MLADEVARGPLEAWLTAGERPAVRDVEVRRHPGRPQRRRRRQQRVDHLGGARADVHRLRGEVDAVLAGVGTVLADDPLLDRPDSARPRRQPLRVVVDTPAARR